MNKRTGSPRYLAENVSRRGGLRPLDPPANAVGSRVVAGQETVRTWWPVRGDPVTSCSRSLGALRTRALAFCPCSRRCPGHAGRGTVLRLFKFSGHHRIGAGAGSCGEAYQLS